MSDNKILFGVADPLNMPAPCSFDMSRNTHLTQCYIPEDMSHQSIRTSGSSLLQPRVCMVRLKFIFTQFSGLRLCVIYTMTYSMLKLPDTAYTIYTNVMHDMLTQKQIKIPHMTTMINLHTQ